MIKSLRDKETEKIFNRYFSDKLPQNIQNTARKKLIILDAVTEIGDLRVPPGNRLEALKGDRKGQHSIRINDQWRICFKWKDGDPMGISQYRLAKDISVPPRRINEIVHGKRSITADTALRLGRFFAMSPQFWLNLQTRYELEVTEDNLENRLDDEVHVLQAQSA